MEYIGLLFELLLLGLGIYLYLFAIGRMRSKDAVAQKNAEAFRVKNAWWLRIGSLALIAIMLINLILHVMALL
ncbi:MAG TPA: hypothetical protein PKA00_03075 [Saprospiraceae bacterium]|nr:hypothetical protein [Saprospiraceae bacterium]HMQ81857.1 hypothetical protein [Saprospiraceae bacterium]